MRKIILISGIVFSAGNVYAQQSLTDQINAVAAVQAQNEAAQQAALAAQQRSYEQQQKAAAALSEKRREAVEAFQKQKEAAALADKKRDQDYQDQLRALDVQDKTLKIEAEKARVARSNDYIDQDLKQKAAETDVIKSQADSNRNISEGTKTLLEKTGDAEVKSQSGIFDK